MASAYSDLARPPLSASRLRAALVRPGSLWSDLKVVTETTSTNADVVVAAQGGAAPGYVVIAEHQRGGRGRLDREWTSPARAGVLLSALVRPQIAADRWPLLPLVAGLGVLEAVVAAGVPGAGLKWPNDVVIDDRKLAGILVERVGDAAIAGVGLNVSTRRDELPIDSATSLLLEGGGTDREAVTKEVLRALERRYRSLVEGADVVAAYREVCTTLGRRVRLTAGTGEVVGVAATVDEGGRLVVREDDGRERTWSAGDVVHLRPEG